MQTEQPMIHSVPLPLEDELAQGLLGRFARLNGLSSFNSASKLLMAYQPRRNSLPKLWLIAEACRLDHLIFTANHSMLPVLSPIRDQENSLQEVANRYRTICDRGLVIPTKQLRWCKTCAHLDVEKRGFSHWRRQHQIVGVDWCIEHQHPLVCTSIESAIYSPGHTTTYGPDGLNQAFITEETQYPAIQRLQNIMLGWLHRPDPIRFTGWAEAIHNRIRLRISTNEKIPMVSDLIREAFPETWLLRHLPHIADKVPNAHISGVDNAFFNIHTTPPSSLCCAAILAVLFDSAEHALAALEAAENQVAALDSVDTPSVRVLTAFLAGQNLHEACEKFGANVENVEAILRRCVKMHPGFL